MSSVSTEEPTLLEGASNLKMKLVAFQQHVINVHTQLGPEPNMKSYCTSLGCQVILSITVGQNLEMKVAVRKRCT